MSRNLCATECVEHEEYPGYTIRMEERPRPITKEEAGPYFTEYEGMLVANAHCPICKTKYLAWFSRRDCRPEDGWAKGLRAEEAHVDLSYRSSFNDEPGPDDLNPSYQWQRNQWQRAQQAVAHAIEILGRESSRAQAFDFPEKRRLADLIRAELGVIHTRLNDMPTPETKPPSESDETTKETA